MNLRLPDYTGRSEQSDPPRVPKPPRIIWLSGVRGGPWRSRRSSCSAVSPDRLGRFRHLPLLPNLGAQLVGFAGGRQHQQHAAVAALQLDLGAGLGLAANQAGALLAGGAAA